MCLLAMPHNVVRATVSKSREWLSFLGQITLVASVELSDEFVRGMVAQSNSLAGQINAQHVVSFEAAHGFWVEPAWQQFFIHTHHILGLAISWTQLVPIFGFLYVFGQVGVTLAFALWVFFYRRGMFAYLRNIFFVTNALAIVLYEAYPLAPPRLAKGLTSKGTSGGTPFQFTDPLFGVLKNGHVAGTKVGFNEFAAMPSLHFGWALIVGITMAWVLRPWALRVLALVYPAIMLLDIVVTGNHYLMDAVGAVGILIIAVAVATLYAWLRTGRRPLGVLYRQFRGLRYGTPRRPAANTAAVAARNSRAVA